MTMLSPHFSLEELTASETADRLGIPNDPSPEQLENLKHLCLYVLEPIRERWGRPVRILSGLRVDALNATTPGASTTSQHPKGEASDLRVTGVSVGLVTKVCATMPGLDFDQLILEFADHARPHAGWTHVSHRRIGNNRRQVLTATRDPATGKTRYTSGLPSWVLALPVP